ncbi:tetratricopeptide repeat protein [Alteraurantiacibacter aquimixticola]|uniref:Uncharacterized protein n=1 Tax=Alteraurantiacibacter aquimixticola TaxID=2489173 RepID=A0A4V4U8B1_9SPHN|nr:tetratricopeptide repeat protein [Alteraurantiacibacter aquimixticola]TIX49007.1 hypothetical protein E5222_14860 [Alteraurantiacibacter aquimixticola]
MLTTLISSLIFAQLALPPTLEEDRLRACMDEARNDPAQAILNVSDWMVGTSGPSVSAPQQCLGFAYMSLLRWDAARQAFTEARDARLESDSAGRARLGAMAGNAAIAAEQHGQALVLLQAAQADATAVGNTTLAGSIASDRARALVGLGRMADGANALEEARSLAPQDASIWLLSATLARRMENLANAQQWIETAAALDPGNLSIGLEAGLVAALGGFDDAARSSWQSVIDTAPRTPEGQTARFYLDQLDEEQLPQ